MRELWRVSATCILAFISCATDVRADMSALDAADKPAITAAWELSVKSDPKTVAFSKTGEGEYHLETTRVPYSGVVRLSNIVIRRSPDRDHGGYRSSATVELTLDVPNRTLAGQYPQSYADWELRNSFYLDPTTEGRWISLADSLSRPARTNESTSIDPLLTGLGSLVVLIVALVAMRIREARAVMRRFKQADAAEKQITERFLAMESRSEEMMALQGRLIELHENQVRLLNELLKVNRRRPIS